METTCAACGAGLRGGETVCPVCGAAVEAFLIASATGAETALLEARLQSAGLPFARRAHKGGGMLALLRSQDAPGADFYVPCARLREAQAALGLEETADDAPAPPGEKRPAQKRRTLVLGLLVTAGLLALLYGLDAGLELLRRLIGGLPL